MPAILGFLGLSKLKLMLFAGLAVAFGLFYWHYTNVKDERDEALGRIGAMEVQHQADKAAIESLEGVVQEWGDSFEQFQVTIDTMADVQAEASEQMRRINDAFSEHDLDQLSRAKPELVERAINDGTADVFRMFERATGADVRGSEGTTPAE